MLNINFTTIAAVASKALADAANHPRWINAIGRAVVELNTNPYIERNSDGGLIIGSQSGNCYCVDTACTCTAAAYGNPCYHRAMVRLVALHDEAIAKTTTRAARIEAAQRATALMNEMFA